MTNEIQSRLRRDLLAARQARRSGDHRPGQLVRLIVAGPGSISRHFPMGNTGRARVPATQPMPIPHDLAELLGNAGR